MNKILKLVRILIAVDIGVVLFSVLEHNFGYFINSQIAFFSATLIIIGSFVGYKNLVNKSVGSQTKDVLKEYEDKYNLYDEEKSYEWFVDNFKDLNKGLTWTTEKPNNFYVKRKIEFVTTEVPEKAKIKKLPWYKAFFLSFKGGFNLIRIFGYIVLVLGFLWLQKNNQFEFIPYFFGLSLVPVLALIFLYIEKNEKN